MSLLSKTQNLKLSARLSPAIQKSGDLRLPTSFTKLSQQYIEDEFVTGRADGLVSDTHMLTMADAAMHPTIAVGAVLEVDEY